ncbi:MAG: PilZ domain-containing protein [Candidatus Omnitrophica bacterium]|nr:PilZ domain-containing protein [Candidatus Omnitrophota bacterium]
MNPEAGSSQLSSSERRKFVRIDQRWYVVFQQLDNALKHVYQKEVQGETRSVSMGGVLFRTREKVAAGALLELEVQLPGEGEPLVAIARVVRVAPVKDESGDGYDAALEFIWLYHKDSGRLNEAILDALKRKNDVWEIPGCTA